MHDMIIYNKTDTSISRCF